MYWGAREREREKTEQNLLPPNRQWYSRVSVANEYILKKDSQLLVAFFCIPFEMSLN